MDQRPGEKSAHKITDDRVESSEEIADSIYRRRAADLLEIEAAGLDAQAMAALDVSCRAEARGDYTFALQAARMGQRYGRRADEMRARAGAMRTAICDAIEAAERA